MENRVDKENAITQQLRIIFKAIQSHSKSVEKTCGLSSIRLTVLHEINNTPGIKVSELAAILSIHRSTCSNLLDKLEDKDLIVRNRSKSDQRSVRLYLTEDGKSILAKAPSPTEGKLNNSLNKLSDQQLERLDESLAVLVDALHFDDDKAALTPIQTS